MDRRSFLLAAAGLAANQLLTGCSASDAAILRVWLLNESVPAQILGAFRSSLKQSSPDMSRADLKFVPELQLQTLFSLLQAWKRSADTPTQSGGWNLPEWVPFVGNRSAIAADLVAIGDYWLSAAVQQQLIQPIDPANISNWAQLPQTDQWRRLVTRNDRGEPDLNGKVWAAPYRWGSTIFAYRRDIFQERGLAPPTDWDDLWRADLRGHISLLNQAREVIGLILKRLRQSYNTTNLNAVAGLREAIDTLRPQVKLYSSDAYLQSLLLGDTWLAVGWSTDILSLLQRSPNIATVIPASGTSLWADLWVRPIAAARQSLPLVNAWLNFTYQPQIANELTLLSRATSPLLLSQSLDRISPELRQNPILLPPEAIMQKSEFLLPLPPATVDQYQALWNFLRQTD